MMELATADLETLLTEVTVQVTVLLGTPLTVAMAQVTADSATLPIRMMELATANLGTPLTEVMGVATAPLGIQRTAVETLTVLVRQIPLKIL